MHVFCVRSVESYIIYIIIAYVHQQSYIIFTSVCAPTKLYHLHQWMDHFYVFYFIRGYGCRCWIWGGWQDSCCYFWKCQVISLYCRHYSEDCLFRDHNPPPPTPPPPPNINNPCYLITTVCSLCFNILLFTNNLVNVDRLQNEYHILVLKYEGKI